MIFFYIIQCSSSTFDYDLSKAASSSNTLSCTSEEIQHSFPQFEVCYSVGAMFKNCMVQVTPVTKLLHYFPARLISLRSHAH